MRPVGPSHSTSRASSNPTESDSNQKQATSRRDFLKGFVAATAASAVPMAAFASRAQDAMSVRSAIPLELNTRKRRGEAFQRRITAASMDRKVPVPSQSGNGDEVLFPNGIASFTKGFPHNQYGEVDGTSYQQYQLAISTGVSSDFDAITMGGTVPLVDPQAGLAFDLEGVDVAQLSIPQAPAFSSQERAAEAVEVYWMALARDVDFSQYSSDPTAKAAAAGAEQSFRIRGSAFERASKSSDAVSRVYERGPDWTLRLAIMVATFFLRRDSIRGIQNRSVP